MDAEDIVRALAAQEPPMDPECLHCSFCSGGYYHDTESYRHDADCPWWRAREWVTANTGLSEEQRYWRTTIHYWGASPRGGALCLWCGLTPEEAVHVRNREGAPILSVP